MEEELREGLQLNISTHIFSLLAKLLSEPRQQYIFFNEILEKMPRANAEAITVRLVPILDNKRFFFDRFLFSPRPKILGYTLAFGSSSSTYASSAELRNVFENIFGIQAHKKAALLLLPIVRVFLRRGVRIQSGTIKAIEDLGVYWIGKRQLKKHSEIIVYFILKEKLIRVDTERQNISPEQVRYLRLKIQEQYQQLSQWYQPFFAIHEIFINEHKTRSILLPNSDEILTDVDKEKIRKALLTSVAGPVVFAQKLEKLLSFAIPLLSDLKKEENSLYPNILRGSVFDFIVGLESVVRWSRQPEEITDPKAKKKIIQLILQESKNPQVKETDLDHTITMLSMAEDILTSKSYTLLAGEFVKKEVMNNIFIHDGGEPFSPFGDVTHADEEYWEKLKATRDEVESIAYTTWWQKRMNLQSLKKELIADIYGNFFVKNNEPKVGVLVKFLDHFQAVTYGFNNIYPYEQIYKDPKKLEEFILKYALADVYKLMQMLHTSAQNQLRDFVMGQLPLSFIRSSYGEAVMRKQLDKSLAAKLIQQAEQTFGLLYEAKNAQEFIHNWDTQNLLGNLL